MGNFWKCLKKLDFNLNFNIGIISITVLSETLVFLPNCTLAQITPDNTLPNNSRTTTTGNVQKIEGGTQAGINLFHSFEQFSVPTGNTAYFNNPVEIQNIISRVTGKSITNIDGVVSANNSANLFLINPNGIIFGNNASLNIGGSFMATTASSLNFSDGTKFSAISPQNTPLLTVSTPIGLQFGTASASIRNHSQASPNGATTIFGLPIGLQVTSGKTLALVGGDIILDEGKLTAPSGRIELGSVSSGSLVSLNPVPEGWVLGYDNALNFQNILLTGLINDLKNSSLLTTSGRGKSGSIQVRGNLVELVGSAFLQNVNFGDENGGDIVVTANKLLVRDGGQILTGSGGKATGGNLIVNAAESIDIVGSVNTLYLSSIFSGASASGDGGNIAINTGRLRIQNGGTISSESSGVRLPPDFLQFLPATGKAGNLTINATKSVELIGKWAGNASTLTASTQGSRNAGQLTINTGELIIRDGAEIVTSSRIAIPPNATYLGDRRNLGKAGDLNINARSILLDNQGKIVSETDLGTGGNITLQIEDFLLMRRDSQISTNAGKIQALGDGGNITINAPQGFIVADRENNDITANGFNGSGGRAKISANGILGIEPRSRAYIATQLGTNDPSQLDPSKLITSDITAISQVNPNLNGVVIINTLDIDTSHGLPELQQEPDEPKLTQACQQNIASKKSQFIMTGRGGLSSHPGEVLQGSNIQADWISLGEDVKTPVKKVQRNGRPKKDFLTPAVPIVEAQGWVVDRYGNILLVDNMTVVTPHSGSCQKS
jgi:filamentous hemagglutinin family protein